MGDDNGAGILIDFGIILGFGLGIAVTLLCIHVRFV